MALLITHIGECLIAEMFKRSQNVRHMISDQFSPLMSTETNPLIISEASINYDSKYGKYGFDGTHRIDVAVLLPSSQKCIAIEVKLGKDRLSAYTFNKRFLCDCEIGLHRDVRIRGSMIAILEGKLPIPCNGKYVFVEHQGIKFNLYNKWILVVLQQIKDNWDRHVKPSLENCVTITFESIVKSYGEPKHFNELVRELVNFDYYKEWF